MAKKSKLQLEVAAAKNKLRGFAPSWLRVKNQLPQAAIQQLSRVSFFERNTLRGPTQRHEDAKSASALAYWL